jgi:stage V sporulation protein B
MAKYTAKHSAQPDRAANGKQKGQNYLHGAAILTVGVIIMKILGFFYKIPLGNLLGDRGYSMFTSAYNIYFIFFTLATAGLPVALSRLVAEADANGRAKQEQKLFRVALATFTVLGLVFAAVMFFFPHALAEKILHNPPAWRGVRAMAPAILLVCMVSAYRGYCQGNGNMLPTTVDEVLEVLFKVAAGLVITVLVLRACQPGQDAAPLPAEGRDRQEITQTLPPEEEPRGEAEKGEETPETYSLSMGSAGAILGVSVGTAVSLLYMVIYKRRHYAVLAAPFTAGVYDPNYIPEDDDEVDSAPVIVKKIFSIGGPIALGACVLALLNLADSGLTMQRLQSAAGFRQEDAQTLYGVYGKAQNLFNLPAAFITPLTISIVPAISAAIARGDRNTAATVSEDSMRISALISIPMGVGLAVLSTPIMRTLYPGSHPAGPSLLVVMGIASFFVCILLMENAILQASGKEKLTMVSLITGGVVKVVTNWFLVARPEINIYGAPVGTLVSYLVMAGMSYFFICRSLPHRPSLLRVFSGPLLSSALMGLTAWGIYGLCSRALAGRGHAVLIAMAVAILAAVLVYAVTAILSRSVTKEDLHLIPGGEKIAKILHIR